MHIALTLPGRDVEFDMTYDPACISDVNTRTMIEQFGCCEPEVVHVMSRVLREGDFAIDAGANVGFFTLLMANLVGPTGRILAFEPGVNNMMKLSDNIGINKLKNVEMHMAALWDKAEDVTLYLTADSGLNSIAPSDGAISRVTMQGVRLDNYCKTVPRFIKIDVEGAEERVLRGAERALMDRVPFITCEMNEGALGRMGSSQDSLRKLMRLWGYQTFILPSDGSLPALVPANTRIATKSYNMNVLFSTIENVGLAWPEIVMSQ